MSSLSEILLELACTLIQPEKQKQLKTHAENAVSSAIAFAQLIAGQRTVYQVCVPPVMGLVKDADASELTNVDEEFSEDVDERSGPVWYVGYPGLIKWGDSVGQRMTEGVVLMNPFVVLKE